MSDFAERFRKLKRTLNNPVKDAAAANQRKRSNDEHDEIRFKQGKKTHLTIPCDIQDLTVKVSFLVIGAQKAGTTWLHVMLKKLPVLSLPQQKEIHFWDWNRSKGLKWYSEQFPSSTNHCLYGEVTPCYAILNREDISEIKYLFPDVKIIFLARDLVDRSWSAILMELRNSVQGMRAGEFGKVDDMDKRTKDKYVHDADPSQYSETYFMDRLMHSTHTSRSDYASAIRKWLEYFPKEQILLLNYEDISNRPRYLLRKVLGFLGLDDELHSMINDDELCKHFNVAPERQAIPPNLRKKMECYLSKYAQEFNTLLDELEYSWKLNAYCATDK